MNAASVPWPGGLAPPVTYPAQFLAFPPSARVRMWDTSDDLVFVVETSPSFLLPPPWFPSRLTPQLRPPDPGAISRDLGILDYGTESIL